MNILCIFYTQDRQTFQTKNYQECKSSVNFTLSISIRFSFPHKFSPCIFIKFLSSDLLKIIFYFFVSISIFISAIIRYIHQMSNSFVHSDISFRDGQYLDMYTLFFGLKILLIRNVSPL